MEKSRFLLRSWTVGEELLFSLVTSENVTYLYSGAFDVAKIWGQTEAKNRS